MDLSQLPKLTNRGKKRVGRGIGSGKGGHTSGRGQKGQNSRNKLPIYFMGAASGASLIKRLPYLRGKGKFSPNSVKPYPINVGRLHVFTKDAVVSVESLVKQHLVPSDIAKIFGVKILGGGDLKTALRVAVSVSKAAKTKIEKAGGVVETKKA